MCVYIAIIRVYMEWKLCYYESKGARNVQSSSLNSIFPCKGNVAWRHLCSHKNPWKCAFRTEFEKLFWGNKYALCCSISIGNYSHFMREDWMANVLI